MNAYRDGVFSVSSPAPRYGSLLTSFEDGSLGNTLEGNAATLLDPVLQQLVAALSSAPAKGAILGYRDAAIALANEALLTSDTDQKLSLAIAASYSAAAFGLPPNTVLQTVEHICSTFAMTERQRTALLQQGASLLRSYLSSKKGSPMSGVYEDGVLGSVYRDGVLGAAASRARKTITPKPTRAAAPAHFAGVLMQQRAIRDGSLGRLVSQQRASRDGVLGRLMFQPRSFRDGSLGRTGCGCAGIGDDTEPSPVTPPLYKRPLVIGGAAVALGIAIYAISRK